MTGDGNLSSRPRALLVGGQRRRLPRRPALPRSTTVSALNPESTSSNLTEGATNTGATANEEGVGASSNEVATSLESSQSMINFYPPAGTPSEVVSHEPPNEPLTPTAGSSSAAAAAESKKKHSFFHFKNKDSARQSPTSSTLFAPKNTPTKAQQLLGAEVEGRPDASESLEEMDPRDDPDDYHYQQGPARSNKGKTVKRYFKERLDSFRSSSHSQLQRHKALEDDRNCLDEEDFLPHQQMPSFSAGAFDEMEANFVNSAPETNDIDKQAVAGPSRQLPSLPDSTSMPNLPRERVWVPNHLRPTKGKSLGLMVPIEEASNDNMRAVYRYGEDGTKLSLNEAYRAGPSRSATLPHARVTSNPADHHEEYELDEEDLSPTDTDGPREDHHVRFPTRSDSRRPPNWLNEAPAMQARGPLQRVEDRILDETKAISAMLDKHDADRAALDARVAAMKASHERFKQEFEAVKHSQLHDLEYPSDEEPVVETARVMTARVVKKGEVKLVDVRPRRA